MPVTTRLPIEADLEAENVRRLSDLINQVYDDAEAGMWKRKGTRIGSGEVERLLREPGALLRRELELLRRPRTHHPHSTIRNSATCGVTIVNQPAWSTDFAAPAR